MIKVTFTDGSVRTFESGVACSENNDNTLLFVMDAAGTTIETITLLEVAKWEKIS